MHELWLSIGRHRRETNWKNKSFTWPELLQKLSNTQRTGETVKDYAAMDKDSQDAIKDIGGFVGGAITGGRRKKGAVTSRSLITLDVDTAGPDFWDLATLTFDCTMCVYSTHKHTPDNPRLRLVIPLAEEVPPDQYQAIGRKIAGMLGIDQFDPTTFQPERLMYWPSTPKDGVYLFEQQDGAFLDPACILAKYKDWRDSSQWPMHSREREHVREGVQQAADPTEKTGVVGAFCRVYGIEAVIAEFLSDVYETAGEGRYTYKHGSTAGGLVVYSDRWAYSHHGTDPVSGQLCNAFDLVRIHKFGRLDGRVKDDTPINKHPSFIAMAEFARRDSAVNLDLVKQQTGRAMATFADVREAGEADDWLKTLETDKRDKVVATAENIMIILRNDPNLVGRFALNTFTIRAVVRGCVPWNDAEGDRWHEDRDDAGLRWYIETTFGFTAVNKIQDCLGLVQAENAFHPVRDYLAAQVWDGNHRVETVLCKYLGAEDNLYTRTVSRKMFVGAVARVMQPGIKFDTALVLIGPQGCGKSSFIAALGGEWYSESFGKLDKGNQAVENIQGVWLMEIPELAAFKNAEVEDIKHFMSKKTDEFRPAYGRNVMLFKRQVSLWATSNRWDFNRDPSGGRRFWPVVVQKADEYLDLIYGELERERGQLWAEAVNLWAAGEALHLSGGVSALAEDVQREHTEKDPWEIVIKEYLEKQLPEKWGSMTLYDRKAYLRGDEMQPIGKILRETVTANEIWVECLEGVRRDMTTAIGRRISSCMQKIEGWKMAENKRKRNTIVERYYVRVADTDGL